MVFDDGEAIFHPAVVFHRSVWLQGEPGQVGIADRAESTEVGKGPHQLLAPGTSADDRDAPSSRRQRLRLKSEAIQSRASLESGRVMPGTSGELKTTTGFRLKSGSYHTSNGGRRSTNLEQNLGRSLGGGVMSHPWLTLTA